MGSSRSRRPASGWLARRACVSSWCSRCDRVNLASTVRARATYRELWRDDLTDQPAVDLALAEMFEAQEPEHQDGPPSRTPARPRARRARDRNRWTCAGSSTSLMTVAATNPQGQP